MFSDVVILAGGFGERLWPASSTENPKQFMTVTDNVSFLQTAVLRALAIKPKGKIVIVTRKDIYATVALHCKHPSKQYRHLHQYLCHTSYSIQLASDTKHLFSGRYY